MLFCHRVISEVTKRSVFNMQNCDDKKIALNSQTDKHKKRNDAC